MAKETLAQDWKPALLDTQDLYHHDALPLASSFRVLELLPGLPHDVISYKLHLVDLTRPPDYEAMSYAWGDPMKRVRTLCHSKDLYITRNLQQALLHLRQSDRSRLLWADALCIDQLNTQEKGHQIRNMQKIYSNAKRVLVWLGPDKDDLASIAVDAVTRLCRSLCEASGVSIPDLRKIEDQWGNLVFKSKVHPGNYPFRHKHAWKSLHWFYSHAWFSRLWVIQEVNSNRNCEVICGFQHLAWEAVPLVAGYIYSWSSFYYNQGFDRTFCYHAFLLSGNELARGDNFLRMLYHATPFFATDPRDKVFGILGLPTFSEQCHQLQVDYTKSVLELCRDVVELAIRNLKNLDVLSFAGLELNKSHPSWIPCWHIKIRARSLRNRNTTWNAANDTLPSWKVNSITNILSISGVVLDEVEVVQPLKRGVVGHARRYRQYRRNFWETVLRHINSPRQRQDALTDCSMAFTYGLQSNCTPANVRFRRADFVEYLASVLGDDISRYPDIQGDPDRAIGNRKRFITDAWNILGQDSFFTTRTGYLGCGPFRMQPGDKVCILLGGRVPYVLRPKGGHYLLVGESYVHGVMDGKVIKDWQAGKTSEFKGCIFDII